jgi:hypothetical protein
VLDSVGKLVRRFSSTDKPEEINPRELNIPTYWIRPPQVLSSRPGMHRWLWDLHYPPPAVARREYPISAIARDTPLSPQGPRALPGEYTVKLTVGGQTYSQPLTVKMDPRVTTPPEGLRQQFEMATSLSQALRQDYDALQQVKRARALLKTLLEPRQALPGALADDVDALEKKLGNLEGVAGEFGARARTDTLAGMNSGLAHLYEVVDSADAAPTSQAIATFAELQQSLSSLLARWNELRSRDIGALNQKLRAANLPAVDVSTEK